MKTCAIDLDDESYNRFSMEIENEFVSLGKRADDSKSKQSPFATSRPLQAKYPSRTRRLLRRALYCLWEVKENIILHLFERRKLRAPLSRQNLISLGYPESGDRNAFEWAL